MTIENKVEGVFKKHDLWYDYEITAPNTCTIFVEWGDWKHDHAYLDYLMEKYGFELVNEELTEDNGSDCYCASHYYRLK